MANRAERRNRRQPQHALPDATVAAAINAAKSGRKPPKAPDGPPDGAEVIEPTPEQLAEIAAAQDAQAAANLGGGDIPPLDQLPPEVREQVERMAAAAGGGGPAGEGGGGPGAGAAASGLLAPTGSKGSRRNKKYADLEKELAVILTLPAAPFAGMGDEFCAMHFAVQGPMLAHRLVVYSESHDPVFKLLTQLVEAGGIATVIIAVIGYLLPPLLHHGMPAPAALKGMYNVPEKAPKHDHGEVVDG